MKFLQIRVDAATHRTLRLKSVDEERPVSEIVREALAQYLAAKKNGKRKSA